MKTHVIMWLVISAAFVSQDRGLRGQTPSGDAILEQIDRNMSSTSRISRSKMIIHGRRGTRTVESKTWARGDEKAFTEYLAPAREKGTKMLKLEDQLWMYSPSTDRTIHISGHMLRQSVMGSDLSYEDMMEDPRLSDNYEAVVSGEDVVNDSECWVLDLSARVEGLAYPARTLWVDKERSIPLREELYAKSGKLLKKLELFDITRLDGRWFPRKLRFKDMLKEGEGTEFFFEDIEFDAAIPEHIFSKAALRR